ncbi:hypothetical protein [Xanthomarina gelatinilytica]|uniref:hypothetical protein n=1 Tax=Xanthomarina gelatinilytica TaxID=1137281 RepID=UPI003AA9C8E3
MKKIYIQLLLTLVGVFSISIQAQTLQTVDGDEFLTNPDGTYTELEPVLSGRCSGCEVPDLNFNWSNSFDAAVANETYIRRAADKKASEWYDRQKVIIEDFLENKFRRQFSSFNEAKDYAFIDFEYENKVINVNPVVSAKNSDKRQRALKKTVHIKGLKALKIRELEVKGGNINNSLYPDFEVNGTPLKDLKSTTDVTAAYNNLLNQFVDNTWKGFESGYIAKILGIPFNDKVLKTKNNYYGSLGTWDKLDFMQFMLNYDQLVNRPSPILWTEEERRLFEKYYDKINTVTATYVDNYVNANKSNDMSLFHPNYWEIIWKRDYGSNLFAINEAKSKHQELKDKELRILINSTSLNATSTIDYLVSLLKITDQDELQWLNDHPEKGDEFLKKINDAKIADKNMPPPVPGELSFPPDYNEQLALSSIDRELAEGAIIGGLVRELEFTDANQKKWLYEHKTEANNFIDFANNHRINDKITDKANAYIKGQVELETLTQDSNRNWKPSTGIIANNPHLKYTHSDRDTYRAYFKLEDGTIIVTSGLEQTLTASGDLTNKYHLENTGNDFGEFYYIKLPGQPFAEMLFNPENLADELKDLFALAGKDIGVSLGRYVLPVEDIKILIDGKDFDGQDVARWQAAGGILLTVVPGGKVVGAGAKVLRPIIKVTKETNVWRVVIKNGSKTYTRIVRELTEETLAHFDRYAPGTKDLIEEALRTGKYIDTTINDAAEVIADISTKKGRTLTWTEVKALFERGRNFNRKASEVYRYNEVTLTTGKRLDTYIPNTAIISRKATTLSNIKPSTFKSYLQELINKYPRGAAINAPKFGNLFKGQTLKGDYFLEIPLSNKTFFENNAIFQKVLSDFNSANNVIVKIKYLAE